MSYSTNPVVDANRHYALRDQQTERQELAERMAMMEFINAVRRGPESEVTGQGIDRNGLTVRKTIHINTAMADSLDYVGGPDLSEVLTFLGDVAYGAGLASQPEKARDLIKRMARIWAEFNTYAE